MNRPNKVSVNSFADTQLDLNPTSGAYNSFTNNLQTPLLNVKGIQLLSATFVNPQLQLNDYSQLMFFYYSATSAANINVVANLKCVRLLPSWYVPAPSFTAYTPNQYFADGVALVSALNAAAGTGGDSVTYNPKWSANDITFTYNQSTKRIAFTGNTASSYYTPAAANDPVVIAYLATNAITMYSTVGNTTASLVQPYISSTASTGAFSMNLSLGYGMSYTNVGRNWGSGSYVGNASSVGYPMATGVPVYSDSFPILLGIQNVNVYCSVITGSGIDSGYKKNFFATIPIDAYPLYVNSYTLTSVESPSLTVNNEIYQLQFDFRDDYGNPVWFNANMSFSMEIVVYY